MCQHNNNNNNNNNNNKDNGVDAPSFTIIDAFSITFTANGKLEVT